MHSAPLNRLMALVFFPALVAGGCRTYRKAAFAGDALMPSALPEATVADGDGSRLAEPGGVERTTNATDRLILYDAVLHMVVPDAEGAVVAIQGIAAGLGGYMQSLAGNTLILRIPAPRLNDAMQKVEQLGEVSWRQVTGTDVTEEMIDLDIRLKNLHATHERLVKLLERAAKVEEVLAVEKELQRVTESLEVLKGRIQYLSHAVRYSTLTVQVNSPLPESELRDVIPFPWVRRLASDVILRPDAAYSPEQRFRRWLEFDVPGGFVKLSETAGATRMVSGEGVSLLIGRHRNFEGGDLDFWTPVVRKSLVGGRAIALGKAEPVTLDSGVRGVRFSGTRKMGRQLHQYGVWLVVSREQVYSFECWGTAEEVEKAWPEVEKSALSMRIRP